jgi:hypothetical protein
MRERGAGRLFGPMFLRLVSGREGNKFALWEMLEVY